MKVFKELSFLDQLFPIKKQVAKFTVRYPICSIKLHCLGWQVYLLRVYNDNSSELKLMYHYYV